MRRYVRSTGFTIIELMIATAVFSTILLLCATGLIAIGRMYQKGNSSRAAQEVARSVMDQIKSDFELSGGNFSWVGDPSAAPGITTGFCIGDNLYTYATNKKTDLTAGNHALVVSQPPGGCTPADTSQLQDLNGTSAKELLGQNMRLSVLNITPNSVSNPTGIAIRVGVLVGDNDLIDGQACKTDAGQEYCAGSVLESYATKRIQ